MKVADIRFMIFGLLVTVSATFGQTYFLGVLQPEIRADYGLSESTFARLYLLVTLGSAIGVSLLGGYIDRTPLPRYMMVLSATLAVSVVTMAVSGPLWLLFMGMLFARLLGQGMMVHAAMASMTRYFTRLRGRALAVSSMGVSVGLAVFPVMLTALIPLYGWRQSVLILVGGFAFFILPLMMLCLKGHGVRHAAWLAAEEKSADVLKNTTITSQEGAGPKSYRRSDMLKDWRFYAVVPVLILAAYWITALFFFADQVAAMRGLTLTELTGSYYIYAITGALTPFWAGWLVDKYTAKRLLWLPAFTMGISILVLTQTQWPIAIFMAFLGIAGSVSIPIMNALWAELFGTRYIGEIKGVTNAVTVLSTALAPFMLGEFLTLGIAFDTLAEASFLHIGVAGAIGILFLFVQDR